MTTWWKQQFGLSPVELVLYFVTGGFAVAALGNASANDSIALLGMAVMVGGYAWLRQRALARHPATGMTSGEVRLAELETQAEELHELRTRVAELEERLDFTERMLAQQRDPAQIGRG